MEFYLGLINRPWNRLAVRGHIYKIGEKNKCGRYYSFWVEPLLLWHGYMIQKLMKNIKNFITNTIDICCKA